MAKIITVGEILVEIMAKKVGQTFLQSGELVGPYPSGAPAIFIDQAARMGASCGIISKVGKDDFGKLVLDRLTSDGVDISQVKVSTEYTTGTAFVTYFHDGSRHFIFHFKQSASGYLNPDDVDAKYFEGCKFFHVMGCSITATESMRNAILKACREARNSGAVICFDPNIRLELLENSEMKLVFNEILAMTDILLSGESEIRAIYGTNEIDRLLDDLIKKGIRIIVLKNGSKGIIIYDGSTIDYIKPIPVEEVDPTGAGDCFDGAFLAMLLDGKSYREAATIANAAGALSVTKKGPMEGAHLKAEVLSFLNKAR